MTIGYYPNTPNVDFNEYFEQERVVIGLYWTEELNEPRISYSISIVPRANTTISMISNARANVTAPYNTPYSVSVVADFCCRRNSTTLELNYGI